MFLFGIDRDFELNFNCQISYGEYMLSNNQFSVPVECNRYFMQVEFMQVCTFLVDLTCL